MKKIYLSIPKPCHEAWDAMAPSDKGRFCGSCQKTVVDFTNMSDRQLLAFFKKPPASVCGRVYNDQLNRDIVLPRKRIPWVRYFFQFTWPAFVLFLKSCGVKENVKGKVKVESRAADVQEHSIATVGMMIPEITPIDTSIIIKEEIVKQGEIMGDTILIDTAGSVAMPVDSSIEEPEIIYKPMDTVVIQSYGVTTGKMILSGAISVCRTGNFQQEKDSVKKEIKIDNEIKFKVYPNPVRAGSLLNISFEGSDDFSERIQILSSSGQLISQLQQTGKDATLTNIQIPSNAAAGIYFLQMITNNNEAKTAKIIVTK